MDETSPNKRLKVSDDQNDLNDKIAKQLNYYFSDVNLIKDKFMREQLEKNENSVKISVLTTFARLAQLTKDEDRIIQALKGFESEYMEVDEEKKQVRRKKPLPDLEEYKKELLKRTVHISGFPDSTLFEPLQKFCTQFGEVESLAMRRHFKSRQFKGCIHVVYKTEADAKKVFESEVLLFKDRELRRETMDQYHKRKEEIMLKRKERKKSDKHEDDSKVDNGDNKETVEKKAETEETSEKAKEAVEKSE